MPQRGTYLNWWIVYAADQAEASAVYNAMPQRVPPSPSSPASMLQRPAPLAVAHPSPTPREEWEVIVTNPPAAHRGAILAMGLGETTEAGNKIILRGFHDDEQAARTAGSIARTYKVGVTFGPRNALYEAAEKGPATAEAPRVSHGFDEHAATELELYADNTSELYNEKVAIIANLKKKMAKGTYNPEMAQTLWMYWVVAAAKRYVKEFGGGSWSEVFPIEVRREVARREEEKERVEMQLQARSAAPLA